MAGSDLFNVGVSGLLAYQRSLNTTSHNIANVNTQGYSRQTVQLSANLPQAAGSGFIGTGVGVETITRSYDAYLEVSMRDTTSSQSAFESYFKLASQIDRLIADNDIGMSSAFDAFASALQDVADSPSDTTARQVLLNQGETLTETFNQMYTLIEDMRQHVNSEMRAGVAEINRLSSSIAALNERIVLETGRTGQPPNDLLDQRDAAVLELAQYTSVTTLQQDDGALNVMIGKGQPVVVANRAFQMGTTPAVGDPDRLDVTLTVSSGVSTVITSQLDSGSFGGLIDFQEQMLDPALNKLGLTATGMSELFNQQHRMGVDLSGTLGNDFFNVAAPQVLTLNGTPGNVTASVADVSALTAADYTIQYASGAWSLRNNETNLPVAMTGTGTALDPFVADGVEIVVTSTPVNGETYEIRPTRTAARSIRVALPGVDQIAAAAPIRSSANIANTGSGNISSGVVTDIDNIAFQFSAGTLSPPVLVEFTAANSYDLYDNSNPAAPVLLEAGIAYNPATGDDVFPTPGGIDQGYRVQITGAPAAGDRFNVDYNTGGVGDNRNMLLLSTVTENASLDGGVNSVRDTYRNLVTDVSIDTRQAQQSSVAQSRVLEQITSSHDSISAVNLDEEAANLVRFQQAYQAAAQVIATASSLFDSLLNAVRR